MHKDIALDSFLHILISRVVSFEFFKKFKIVFISIIVHIYRVWLGWVPQHVCEGHRDNFMELVSPSTIMWTPGVRVHSSGSPNSYFT